MKSVCVGVWVHYILLDQKTNKQTNNLAFGIRREIGYAGDHSGQAVPALKSFFYSWKLDTAIMNAGLGPVRSDQIPALPFTGGIDSVTF